MKKIKIIISIFVASLATFLVSTFTKVDASSESFSIIDEPGEKVYDDGDISFSSYDIDYDLMLLKEIGYHFPIKCFNTIGTHYAINANFLYIAHTDYRYSWSKHDGTRTKILGFSIEVEAACVVGDTNKINAIIKPMFCHEFLYSTSGIHTIDTNAVTDDLFAYSAFMESQFLFAVMTI